jgi:hypothetical protein
MAVEGVAAAAAAAAAAAGAVAAGVDPEAADMVRNSTIDRRR